MPRHLEKGLWPGDGLGHELPARVEVEGSVLAGGTAEAEAAGGALHAPLVASDVVAAPRADLIAVESGAYGTPALVVGL